MPGVPVHSCPGLLVVILTSVQILEVHHLMLVQKVVPVEILEELEVRGVLLVLELEQTKFRGVLVDLVQAARQVAVAVVLPVVVALVVIWVRPLPVMGEGIHQEARVVLVVQGTMLVYWVRRVWLGTEHQELHPGVLMVIFLAVAVVVTAARLAVMALVGLFV